MIPPPARFRTDFENACPMQCLREDGSENQRWVVWRQTDDKGPEQSESAAENDRE